MSRHCMFTTVKRIFTDQIACSKRRSLHCYNFTLLIIGVQRIYVTYLTVVYGTRNICKPWLHYSKRERKLERARGQQYTIYPIASFSPHIQSLKMEAVCFSEMLMSSWKSTWGRSPEDQHRVESVLFDIRTSTGIYKRPPSGLNSTTPRMKMWQARRKPLWTTNVFHEFAQSGLSSVP